MERRKRRRDQRQADPPPMQLTGRDKQIVEAVHLYRVLRQDQLERLIFGSKSAAQRVLVRLYDHGFLERRFVPVLAGRSPAYYVLDRRGAELLRAELGYDELSWYPSSKDLKADFLEHTLAINDARIAVVKACERLGYPLVVWLGETELKADYDQVRIAGQSRPVAVIPDGYFAIDTPRGRAHFFLEVDRGSMTLARFTTKVEAYIAYYRSGKYEARFGAKGLRILTATPSQARLDNLRGATAAAAGGHKNRFWFAVQATLTAETALDQPVWYVAGEETTFPLIELPERGG
jgi:predicted transcriptional regulator